MRRWLVGALGAALLLGLAATAFAETHVVIVRSDELSPAELTVQRGDVVRWEWESGSHTLADGDPARMDDAGRIFDIALNSVDNVFEMSFNNPETVTYFSRSNPDLRGTITILDGTPVNRATWGYLKRMFEDTSAPRSRN